MNLGPLSKPNRQKCSICGEYRWGTHECPPAWRIYADGEFQKTIYAPTAGEAAVRYVTPIANEQYSAYGSLEDYDVVVQSATGERYPLTVVVSLSLYCEVVRNG